MSVYTDVGYDNRKDYLDSLADDFGIPRRTVYELANVLGPEEDFDALITELEDIEGTQFESLEEGSDEYIGKVYCKKEFDGTVNLFVKGKNGDVYTCQYLSDPQDKSSVIHEFKLDKDDLEWSIEGATKINESYINENDMMGDSVNNMDINRNNFFDVEDIFGDEIVQQEENDTCLDNTAKGVMTAYQNANKWLDTIKEFLFTDLGCVYFSSYVHNLAHTMPTRFDKFGDILHTVDYKIPYPATEYIPQEPTDINTSFDLIFMILDSIKDNLNAFIKCTDDKYHGMACAAETLLNDIESEYVPLFKMRKAWENYQDNVRFDKWVGQYVASRSNLAESYSHKHDHKHDRHAIRESVKNRHRKKINESRSSFPTVELRPYKVILDNKEEHTVYAQWEKEAWDIADKKFGRAVDNVYLDESLNEDKTYRVIDNDTNEPMRGGSDFRSKTDADRAVMNAKAAANEWDDVDFPKNGYRVDEIDESLNEAFDTNVDMNAPAVKEMCRIFPSFKDYAEDGQVAVEKYGDNSYEFNSVNKYGRIYSESTYDALEKAGYKQLETGSEDYTWGLTCNGEWTVVPIASSYNTIEIRKASPDEVKAMNNNEEVDEAYGDSRKRKPDDLQLFRANVPYKTLTPEECKKRGYMIGRLPYDWIEEDAMKVMDYVGINSDHIADAKAGTHYLMTLGELTQAVRNRLGMDSKYDTDATIALQKFFNDLGWEIEEEPQEGSREYNRQYGLD